MYVQSPLLRWPRKWRQDAIDVSSACLVFCFYYLPTNNPSGLLVHSLGCVYVGRLVKNTTELLAPGSLLAGAWFDSWSWFSAVLLVNNLFLHVQGCDLAQFSFLHFKPSHNLNEGRTWKTYLLVSKPFSVMQCIPQTWWRTHTVYIRVHQLMVLGLLPAPVTNRMGAHCFWHTWCHLALHHFEQNSAIVCRILHVGFGLNNWCMFLIRIQF